MVSYAPYFISTVVICGMIAIFMDKNTGIFNQIIVALGGEAQDFLSKPQYFKSIYVWSGVWQGMGYSSIIYISALSGVDPALHEAAIMDGATKVQRILHIDLPSIKSTIIMLLILQMGSLMNVGFEKVFLLQNDLNMSASDVINTYVYRVGLVQNNYSSWVMSMFLPFSLGDITIMMNIVMILAQPLILRALYVRELVPFFRTNPALSSSDMVVIIRED